MPVIPSSTITLSPNPFIGENYDLSLSFDNFGDEDGFGPFSVLYLPATGTDGADGLDFISANYLGADLAPVYNAPITAQNITDGYVEITVFGHPYQISIPTEYVEGDKLVVFELPFGSFVVDQPVANINVTLGGTNFQYADLNQPLNITTQGGFIFGNSASGTPGTGDSSPGDTIIQNTVANPPDTGSVEPQLVTIEKIYLGPEDETATGPNFERQYQLVVDIADGQTLTNLELTDLLPDNMQFVSLDSIEANPATVDPLTGGYNGGALVTPSSTSLPSTTTPGGILEAVMPSVTGGSGEADLVLTFTYYIPRLDSSSAVIIDATNADDVNSENQGRISDGSWTPLDNGGAGADGGDGLPDDVVTGIVANPDADTAADGTALDSTDPDHILEDQAIAIQKTVATATSGANIAPGTVLEYTLEFQVSDYFAFDDIFITDFFSDGQRLDTSSPPTLEITEHGNSTGTLSFTFPNTPAPYDPDNSAGVIGDVNNDHFIIDETEINNTPDGNGDTKLTFEISKYLIDNNIANFDDGRLVGGAIQDGGLGVGGSFPDDSSLPFGATEGVIKFRTKVRQNYTDIYPAGGDPSLDAGDTLTNT